MANVPTTAELTSLLRAKIDARHQAVEEGKKERGYIGYINLATNTWVIHVPTRRNYVYVTLKRSSSYAVVEALCLDVTPKGGLDVIVEREEGEFVVKADRHGANTFTSGGVNLTVGKHTHQLGQGNEDFVEGGRFLPFLCHITPGGNSLFIQVEAGSYRYNNADVTFLGNTFNMTPYLPSVAGMHCWAKVGLDLPTNTLTAVKGSDVALVTPLTPAMLDAIDLGADVAPLSGVELKNGQTAITDFRAFYDCRPFLTGMNTPSGGSDEALYLALAGL